MEQSLSLRKKGYFKMTKSLRRKVGGRERRKKFVIVCEGTVTEPIYFRKYRTRYDNLEVIIPDSRCTDPKGLVKFCQEQIDYYPLDFRYGDVIWCVFDWDNNTQEAIFAAFRKAKNVKLCLSNPSYELWYLLHFMDRFSKLNNDELKEKLEKYIPNYDKSKDYFELLESKRISAISRAKRLNQMHEKNGVDLKSINSNPSTQVFKIIEELLSITQHSI